MTRLDRRALFTSGAAAALLAATGLRPEAQPKAGGRLRLALAREDGALAAVARSAMFDTLTEVAPNGTLRGELSSSWSSDATARHWTFQLRDDAVFHDQTVFGAPDAVRVLGAHPAFERARITARDHTTVAIDLTDPDPQLPMLLSDIRFAMTHSQDTMIGTGLYQQQRFDPDRHFLGARVAQHYKDGQAGWFDSIDAIVIPDSGVRAEALRDGFVDVAQLPKLEGLPGRGGFVFHPSVDDVALVAQITVGVPAHIGTRAPLDDGRIGERWWMA
ncbi:MAG: ABC transporter substrate-binding protein [Sedimentitalea sp.]